jgi:K+-sensing histidine kinase KdpD
VRRYVVMKRSIRALALVVFAVFLAVAIASAVSGLWVVRDLQHDALLLNLLGRQRMLSQRMVAEALLVVKGKNPAYRQPLHRTAHVFRQNMDALLSGGEALYAEGRTVIIPPVRDPPTRARLEGVKEIWDEVHRSVHQILDASPDSPAAESAMRTIELLSPVLVSRLDEIVQAYEAASRRKVTTLLGVELLFLLLGFATAGTGYLLVRRSIVNPVLLLQKASLHLARGDFGASLPPPGEDEIGSLSNSFHLMRTKLKRSLDRGALLLSLSRDLLSLTDPRAVKERVVNAVQATFDADYVSLMLPDPTGKWLVLEAGAGWEPEMVGAYRVEVEASREGHVFRTAEPVYQDYTVSSPFPCPPELQRRGIKSSITVPLSGKDGVLGTLCAHSTRQGAFDEEDVGLLATMASHAAVALERARALRELTSVYKVSSALRTARTTQELASILTKQAAHMVDADVAMLCIVDKAETYIETISVFGLPEGAVGRRHGAGEGISGHVLRTGKIYRSPVLTSDPLVVHRDLMTGLGPGVCVPVRTTEDRVIGTFLVARVQGKGTPFGPDDERFLSLLMEIGANALERASLFEELSRQQEATELMASMAAHEVRRIAGDILILLERFEEVHAQECNSNEANRLIRSALRALEVLGQGAQDLMDFVGLKTTALRMTLEDVRVEPVLEEVAYVLSGLAARKRQSIVVAVQEGLPTLRADRKRLGQVVANLLKNALQVSPEEATVYLRAVAGEGEVTIEVEDCGWGISKEDLERIFQPYFRTETAKGQYSGHGLGLALCKIIVEAHGGRIYAVSDLGRGTTFRVVLPLPTAEVRTRNDAGKAPVDEKTP